MKLFIACNNAPVYRKGIFTLMDKTYECDWFFGEALSGIKQFDVSILQGKVTITQNVDLGIAQAYWQKGILKFLFKDYDYYILLGEERCLSTWMFCLLSRFIPRKRVYFWTHGVYGREGIVKRVVEWVFDRLVNGSFVYSNYSRDIMISRGLNPNSLFTIHNSLDYDKQLELRQSGLKSDVYLNHFGNSNPVLIMIGRLNLRKRLSLLFEAVSVLKQKGEMYNIVLIGDGEDKESLKKIVEEKELVEQTWFYGACYDEKTNAELIYNADLCVVPGDVGLTAIHSMMFGTPVVSHDYYPNQGPEFESIQPGITGDFFKHEDFESLSQTIHKWFGNEKDRDIIRQACYHEIDTQWTPQFQLEVLKNHLK